MRKIGQNSFKNCGSLRTVFFDHNFIEEVPVGVFRTCGNLNWLKLRFNRIKKIDPLSFEGLVNLKDLELEGNQITSVVADDFKYLPMLRTLWISRNPLSKVNPGDFPEILNGLELIDCGITEIHPEAFLNLTQLTYLNLAQNPITFLPPGVFSRQLFLFNLFLDNTKIKRLNSNAFGRHEAMQELHIKSAELDEIQLGFFENFPFLMDFDARDNPCVNASIQNVQSIDFFEDVTLHECFANWFVPRESTTVPSVSDDGINLAVNGILMGIFVILRFVIC
jgi:carboxypeptidase N regulatory subunit